MDHRQLPQQDGIEHAENRRVRANTQRQGKHRNRSKSRILDQHPDSVANVLQQCSHFPLPANASRCKLPAANNAKTPAPVLPKKFSAAPLAKICNARSGLAYTDTLRVPTVSSTIRPSKR